jgi:hypothetical protein
MSSADGRLGRLAVMRRGGKEKAVFPLDQGFVELEQVCRLDERAKLRNQARTHPQRGQSERHAMEGGEIRGATPGTIANEQLMLQQRRFGSDGTYATWAQKFYEGDQQMDGQKQEVAHEANRTTTTNLRKTAPYGEFRHPASSPPTPSCQKKNAQISA